MAALTTDKRVVCDTAKVRFFKQITTKIKPISNTKSCLRYCKSTIFQANHNRPLRPKGYAWVVCDTAKVRFFKQITTRAVLSVPMSKLFAILQKYDFSSKSQRIEKVSDMSEGCLRYCKSTIFQANHNPRVVDSVFAVVVCDTAKVRFFKQITTDVSLTKQYCSCLRYCKSTIFQANHNCFSCAFFIRSVVCDTAKVRFFKQITTQRLPRTSLYKLFAILHKYDFSSKSQPTKVLHCLNLVVCDTAKVRFFKQITTMSHPQPRGIFFFG